MKKRIICAVLALLSIFGRPPVHAQTVPNGGNSLRVTTNRDLLVTAVEYCALASGSPRVGTVAISAAASNTVTGTNAFTDVAIGDELTINTATASYLVGVTARASASSITVSYRLPTTGATSTLTFTNVTSWTYQKISCSTGVTVPPTISNTIPMNYGPLALTLTVFQFNVTGTIDWNVLCRPSPASGWSQIAPVLAADAIGPTYRQVTAASAPGVLDPGPWYECRVGIWINGTDTGPNIYSISVARRSY